MVNAFSNQTKRNPTIKKGRIDTKTETAPANNTIVQKIGFGVVRASPIMITHRVINILLINFIRPLSLVT